MERNVHIPTVYKKPEKNFKTHSPPRPLALLGAWGADLNPGILPSETSELVAISAGFTSGFMVSWFPLCFLLNLDTGKLYKVLFTSIS